MRYKYDDIDDTCTIYLLINKINKKLYVGQSWSLNLEARMGRDGNRYKNSPHIHSAIKKYGAENFEYKILATCNDQRIANRLESFFRKLYNTTDPNIGYNLIGEYNGDSHGKHSEKTKEKISNSLKGEKSYWFGKEIPDNIRRKISDTKKLQNLKHTDEWKQNNSIFMKERHKTYGHPMKDQQHTEITKIKISATQRGITIEEYEQYELSIINEYANKTKIVDICKKFNTTPHTIHKILDKHQINRPKKTKALNHSK